MKRLFPLLLITALFLTAGCKDPKRDYIEKVAPVLNNLEQIGLEIEKTVEAIKSDGISIIEFEAKISDIEKRLNAEKENFNHNMAPVDLDLFHKNILEAIAGEQLAISSVRSYATRKNMYNLAEKQLLQLQQEESELLQRQSDEKAKTRLSKISQEKANLAKQKENLQTEMDSQMKFFSNSHDYSVKMLRAMKNGLKGRSK
ncbi:MAG: hypothetical protein N3B13_09765 [Deltaproteobacteria bacterium]|nr:hypothetical protein [Deltaproteobacteria bacterium]